MEKQIRKYQSGSEVVADEDPFEGDINSSQIDPNDLMNLLNPSIAKSGSPVLSPSFEQSFNKYSERLKPYAYQAPKMSIYDVASDLGAAILATPATGNAFEGIGRGFSAVSNRIRQNQKDNQKLNQQVAMQAASMAMEDEKSANDYLQKYSMEMLKVANDPGDLVQIEFDELIPKLDDKGLPVLDETGGQLMVPSGNRVRRSFRDNPKNAAAINRLLEEQNGLKITGSGTSITVGDSGDKEYIKSLISRQETIFTEARAASGVVDQVNYARSVAERLGRDGYGSVQGFLVPIKNIMVGAGLGAMVDESKLGDQVLMNQLGIGFAMAIVGQTKGAISNREMEMFLAASPVLTSTYDGFMKQLDYLERIAERSEKYSIDFSNKLDKLEDEKFSASKTLREMDKFAASWRKDNPLFDEAETNNLVSLGKGDAAALESGGYTIGEGFNYGERRQQYRSIQAGGEVSPGQPPASAQSIKNQSFSLAQEIEQNTEMSFEDKKVELQSMLDKGLPLPQYMINNFGLREG
tara:strand:- start:280 stop:1845 length:1566 start_codon:yes stop_codon:yes gene_type:complete